MKEYLYSYQSITKFASKVSSHSWLLRCDPYPNCNQSLLKSDVTVFPAGFERVGKDSWGSTIRYGRIESPHDIFGYISTGIVRLEDRLSSEDNPKAYYRMGSALTQCSSEMAEQFAVKGLSPNLDSALLLCNKVHSSMEYCQGSTSSKTTAMNALSQGKGVCQDFSHILLALCREAGIPARYVCGLVEGEGETHAWVEVWYNGLWYPIDPTLGDLADPSKYIKIAHGRDAFDCPVNRGLFTGAFAQSTETKVIVERL